VLPGEAQSGLPGLAGQHAAVLLASPACTPLDPGAGQGGAERGQTALVARRKITGTVGKSSMIVFPLPHSDAVVCLRRYRTTIGNPET
jgi:hypothetical protein